MIFILFEFNNLSMESVYAEKIISSLGMGLFEINGAAIIEIGLRMIPFWVFQILYGTQIYINICEGGVYYIYRCTNRGNWIIRQMMVQFGLCFLYGFIYYIIAFIFAYVVFGVNILQCIGLIIWGAFVLSLYSYCSVIFVNLISFLYNSALGIVLTLGSQMLLISLFLLFQRGAILDIYSTFNIVNVSILKYNILAHFVTAWHSFENNEGNIVGISMLSSFLLYVILAVVISVILYLIVLKLDIIEEKRN